MLPALLCPFANRIETLQCVNEFHQVKVHFQEPKLGGDSGKRGWDDAVSEFVYDIVCSRSLSTLVDSDVRFELMRYAGHNNVDLYAPAERGICVHDFPVYSPLAAVEFVVTLLPVISLALSTWSCYLRVRGGHFIAGCLAGFEIYRRVNLRCYRYTSHVCLLVFASVIELDASF